MSILNKLNTQGAALAMGGILSASWYASTQAMLSGTAAQIIPVAGAIALAGVVPFILGKKARDAEIASLNLNFAQRLMALDRHVLVNVVDNQNRLTEVNDKMIQVMGYDRRDLIGQHVNMLYSDEAGQRLAATIREHLIQGETWQGETPLRCADGSTIVTYTTVIPIFDENGEWEGSISARTDMTESNKLADKQETVETLDELRDDIWVLNADTQKFTYMNKAALRRMSWSAVDMVHKGLDDTAKAEDTQPILEACHELRDSGEGIAHFEANIFDRPFNITIKFLRVDKHSDRFLIVLNDISQQRLEEQKKSDFIAMVSHELRSPLTSIKGSMGLLLSNAAGELPEKASALLEIAHRNADRLVLIINDILDLEKITAGGMDFDVSEVDISALVQETNEANHMLHHRFSLEVDVTGVDQPIAVNTDPNRIIQVLNNFISNACKFSKPGGKIQISVEEQDQEVRVSVRDQGAGIPPEDHDKIFQRFADLTNSDRAAKGGTGLGLSICKAIVESLGGTIGFDTKVGEGTTFYFVLPKAEGLGKETLEEEGLREAS